MRIHLSKRERREREQMREKIALNSMTQSDVIALLELDDDYETHEVRALINYREQALAE
jgi:hypothetical protein